MKEPYMADILDSAQEAFPSMWVNGEKYVFSEHVTTKGISLYQKFKHLKSMLPQVQSRDKLDDLKQCLI
jgi:hypothetical protein